MLIITGTYPPRKCGVGDYCQNLLGTETAKSWKLYTHENWSLTSLFKKTQDIKNIDFKVANIQYPTMGYGTSLLPHFIAIYIKLFLRKKLIITFHEYSRLGWKGQFAAKILFLCADKIIFTTEFERQYAINKNKFVNKKSSIIKIFSNIQAPAKQIDFNDRKYHIGYFGYIRPDKGLEDFITSADLILKQNPDFKIYIMGQTQTEYKDYHEPLLNSVKDTKIKIFLNKDMEEVSKILSDTKIAYLPYPDGLTERRGSFLAALLHNCIIVSTKGKFTTNAQLSTFNFVNKETAHREILNLLEKPHDIIAQKIADTQKYIKEQVPDSWESVASEYNNIINQIL